MEKERVFLVLGREVERREERGGSCRRVGFLKKKTSHRKKKKQQYVPMWKNTSLLLLPVASPHPGPVGCGLELAVEEEDERAEEEEEATGLEERVRIDDDANRPSENPSVSADRRSSEVQFRPPIEVLLLGLKEKEENRERRGGVRVGREGEGVADDIFYQFPYVSPLRPSFFDWQRR